MLGVDAMVAMGDVGIGDDCRRIAAEAIARFGAVDVLVNNAAIRPSDDFLAMSEEKWRRVLAVDLDAAFWLSRACLPGMLEKKWGRIINFVGMNAIHGYAGRAHVSVSKHGVWGLTKALGKEFGPKGVTTNVISPGPIAGERDDAASAQHIADMVGRVPVGRLGTVEEIARCVTFLAADEAGFITGACIDANGGQYMA